MNTFLRFLVVLFIPFFGQAQGYMLSGTIIDNTNTPVSFATVLISEITANDTVLEKGTTTDDFGNFNISELQNSTYIISISFMGFETIKKEITLIKNTHIGSVVLLESSQMLEETVLSVKRPTIKKSPGKLTFTVENTSVATGSTLDILTKTPGVFVTENGINIKNTTPLIYINNRRVYLSAQETRSLLQSTDATLIKAIEVITNPSSKYDAEAGTVINITTTKAISVGYKGSVNGTYEQAVFSKYRLGTAHFYKNNWLNAYGSYTFSPRKEFKEDDNTTRFFEPNETETAAYRSSLFTRITRSNAHQGNVVLDVKANKKHSFGFSAAVFVLPNERYNNNAISQNLNIQREVDSAYTTASNIKRNTSNLAFNLNHTWALNDAGANVVMNTNYISYNADRNQEVATQHFLPNQTILRNNSFFTQANQDSKIATSQLDFTLPAFSATIETGIKYSSIVSTSGLDFYDLSNQGTAFNESLSDFFEYDEGVFAGYISYSREWKKWSLQAGLRGEHTNSNGNTRSLGVVNTQNYFDLFPNLAVTYAANNNNNVGLSYSRSISRPRYESLNPFRYFINENNFNDGNPNLIPAIDTKYTLSYTYKNTWFFEAYYWHTKNPLQELKFQNNTTRVLQNIYANLIQEYQYSFDIIYAKPLTSWWYLQVITSSFYIENEFFAQQSSQEKATNNTAGFYGQMYSGLTLSEKSGITSDITALYISNLIFGSHSYKNQFNLSASFKKDLWKKRASITMGVDDIFNTNNIPVNSRYLNQDNSYFARAESRMFRLGFKYNFGNARLRDNNRATNLDEGNRL